MKSPKYALVLIAMGVFIVCAGSIVSILIKENFFRQDERWKQHTSPLPQDTVDDICASLLISNDSICQNKREVYAPDFFSSISKVLDRKETTYQEVQLKVGKYQVELEDLTTRSDGSTYFVSYYDLRGDGVTSIVFFFEGTYFENRLIKIEYHYDRFGF